jgi:hypothetical protein
MSCSPTTSKWKNLSALHINGGKSGGDLLREIKKVSSGGEIMAIRLFISFVRFEPNPSRAAPPSDFL